MEDTYFCIFGTLTTTPEEMLTKILRLELQVVKESQKLQGSVWERRV